RPSLPSGLRVNARRSRHAANRSLRKIASSCPATVGQDYRARKEDPWPKVWRAVRRIEPSQLKTLTHSGPISPHQTAVHSSQIVRLYRFGQRFDTGTAEQPNKETPDLVPG